MTPPARAQAAIDILDLVIAAAREAGPPADAIIADYFRTRRYAGSGDRRGVRELVYAAIRRAGERPENGRAALLGVAADDPQVAAMFDGTGHGPGVASETEERSVSGIGPAWLVARLPTMLNDAERAALLNRAPLDLRVNALKADVASVLAEFPDAVPGPHGGLAVRLPEGTRIEDSAAYRGGRVEVQDAGSQLIVAACCARRGMQIVDLCAGAGGKSLGLAADMEGPRADDGRLIACDTDRGRLSKLTPRAQRAGATIETRLLNPRREFEALSDVAGKADVVLVDAPCSGTGTWRRNPEARWRLTPERLSRLVRLQAELIDLAATLVKPGGHLVYAVCSLLPDEGEAVVAAFLDRQSGLNRHSGWRSEDLPFTAGRVVGAGRILTPLHDDTDGFYIARLRSA